MLINIGDGRQGNVDETRYNHLMQYRDAIYNAVTSGSGGNYNFADAGEAGSFIVGQLAYTEAQVYEVLQQPLQYAKLIPMTSEAGAYADSVRYEIVDYTGQSKRIAPGAKDLPEVGVSYKQASFPIYHGALQYSYNTQELRESAFLRRPINAAKAVSAYRAIENHVNQVALFGEQDLTGLVNNVDVPVVTAPAGASYPWMTTATPAQILADLNSGLSTVWQNTQKNDFVTTVLFPDAIMSFLVSTLVPGTYPSKTILQFLRENNIGKVLMGIDLEFDAISTLSASTLPGHTGVNQVIFYTKRPDRIKFHRPMMPNYLAPQPTGLNVVIPGEHRYSGTTIYYPYSALYMIGM